MTFGHEVDIRAAEKLLAVARDLEALGEHPSVDSRERSKDYRIDNHVNVASGIEPELTVLAHVNTALRKAMARVVDGDTEHAALLLKKSRDGGEIFPVLERLSRSWFPERCWNTMCIATFCPGVDHIGAQGTRFTERRA